MHVLGFAPETEGFDEHSHRWMLGGIGGFDEAYVVDFVGQTGQHGANTIEHQARVDARSQQRRIARSARFRKSTNHRRTPALRREVASVVMTFFPDDGNSTLSSSVWARSAASGV